MFQITSVTVYSRVYCTWALGLHYIMFIFSGTLEFINNYAVHGGVYHYHTLTLIDLFLHIMQVYTLYTLKSLYCASLEFSSDPLQETEE